MVNGHFTLEVIWGSLIGRPQTAYKTAFNRFDFLPFFSQGFMGYQDSRFGRACWKQLTEV